MAANAKYTAAPTQDPDDHLDYTSAPPSYQATGSSAAQPSDAERLASGVPRSSEDDLPDDFKFGGNVAEATVEIRHQFIRKVYSILTVQLLITGGVSALGFMSTSYRDWVRAHPGVLWLSVSCPILLAVRIADRSECHRH